MPGQGRVHKHEAHPFRGKTVFFHRISKLDVLRALPFDEHVREGDCMGIRNYLLAVEIDGGAWTGFVELLLGDREHSSGAARKIPDLDNLPGFRQVLATLRECEFGDKANNLARRIMVASLSILGKPSDNLLEHISHSNVVHVFRVEVKLGELSHHAGEL